MLILSLVCIVKPEIYLLCKTLSFKLLTNIFVILWRLWKYEADTIGKSEFLLDSSLIETLEFDNDVFAAGKISSFHVCISLMMFDLDINHQCLFSVVTMDQKFNFSNFAVNIINDKNIKLKFSQWALAKSFLSYMVKKSNQKWKLFV